MCPRLPSERRWPLCFPRLVLRAGRLGSDSVAVSRSVLSVLSASGWHFGRIPFAIQDFMDTS